MDDHVNDPHVTAAEQMMDDAFIMGRRLGKPRLTTALFLHGAYQSVVEAMRPHRRIVLKRLHKAKKQRRARTGRRS